LDKGCFPGELASTAVLPTTLPVGLRSGQWPRVHANKPELLAFLTMLITAALTAVDLWPPVPVD